MLIAVIVLLVFLLQSLYSSQGKEKLAEKKLDIVGTATNILLILANSKDCLAYEYAQTVEKANILDVEKLDSFYRDYQEIEPDCARNHEFGWRVKVSEFGMITGDGSVITVHSRTGSPTNLIDDVHNIDDHKWWDSTGHGYLASWGNEVIGSDTNPLKVRVTGLNPSKKYKVEFEIFTQNAGKNLWIRRSDLVGYTLYNDEYGDESGIWAEINLGEVTGRTEIGVDVYLDGGTGEYDVNLGDLIVTEVGGEPGIGIVREWDFGSQGFSTGKSLNNEVHFWIPVTIRYSENDMRLGKMEIQLVDGELEKLAGFFDWSCKMGQLNRMTSSSTQIAISQPVTYDSGSNKICMGGSCRKLDECQLLYFDGLKSKGTHSITVNYKNGMLLVGE